MTIMTIKIEDLVWEARGCCGEHLVASVDLADGRTISIDRSGDVYVVVVIRDGLATSPPEVVNGDEGLAEWLKSVSA